MSKHAAKFRFEQTSQESLRQKTAAPNGGTSVIAQRHVMNKLKQANKDEIGLTHA
jgi:hypothetical protein